MRQLHVLFGRFEPFHNSHRRLVEAALEGADHLLIVLGSSYQAPSCKNPFSWEERAQMIASVFPHVDNIRYYPLRDSRYNNDEWRQAALVTVQRFGREQYGDEPFEVTLVGTNKPGDAMSAWYLHAFPEWNLRAIPASNFPAMDATQVRDNLFKGLQTWERYVPRPVREFLDSWIHTEEGRRLRGEYLYCKREAALARRYPWPLTYVTADAVIYWRGKVLLIRRNGELGRGLWALPGGFIDAKNETCYQSAKRESNEETGIQLLDEWCLTPRDGRVYDSPRRSLRGRTITHAYMFVIPDEVEVPPLEGADDASYACWYPLHEIPGLESRLFEDHIDIIRDLTRSAGIEQPMWRPEIGL